MKRRRPPRARNTLVEDAGEVTKRIRMSEAAEARIQWLADTYAGGNFSLWIRYAALEVQRRYLVEPSGKQSRGKKKLPEKKGA